jgi:hypothetical protein
LDFRLLPRNNGGIADLGQQRDIDEAEEPKIPSNEAICHFDYPTWQDICEAPEQRVNALFMLFTRNHCILPPFQLTERAWKC